MNWGVFTKLAPDSHNLRGYTKEAKRVLGESKESYEFVLEPNAWLDAFNITDPKDQARWNGRIVERVRELEERAHKKRVESGKTVIGRQRLMKQKLNTTYRPDRSGRRMWCLSGSREQRRSFIKFLMNLRDEARDVWKRWHMGDFSVPYPLGLYPPSMPKLAEPLGMW